jgi:glyoxylase-like metal-dependent hydrolase (beta-lactamase superfamily II)
MNKLNIKSFTFNPFQENTYIVSDEDKNCVVIDPGFYERAEQTVFFQYIEDEHLTPLALLNTHAHIDHVLGNALFLKKYPVDYYLHQEDVFTLRAVESYAHVYGFEGYLPSPLPNQILKGGESLKFGKIEFEAIFGPGHAPGHLAFYNKENQLLINGDILFQGSFGRVDLPGGNLETLKKTIFDVLFQLPDETNVYCGHGPATNIGEEKKHNMIWEY